MESSENPHEEALKVQLETLVNLLYLAQHHLAKEREYIEWAEQVVQELLRNPALKTEP